MGDAFVLGGVRTPFGRYGGALSDVRTDDLLGQTMVWACERVGADLDRIEDIAAGCVNVPHEGMGDVARWAALAAGFPDSVPAATVNRFCASSLTCAIQITHAMRSGELGVGVAGGVESMSRSGWAYMKGDAPFMPRGPVLLLDTMWARRRRPAEPEAARARRLRRDDPYCPECRRALLAVPGADRRVRAALSHQGCGGTRLGPVRARDPPGRDSGNPQATRVDVPARRVHPRRLDRRGLAALPPQPGTAQVTAGNSSPLNDGASVVVLASAEAAEELAVQPLARVAASATVANDPQLMGIAPAFAIPVAIRRAGLTPQEIDVWEVHEAFSAQALGVLSELPNQLGGFEVPDEKLNPNGGAVATGTRSGPQAPATCSHLPPS
jgi:acetyl-CoA acetyltransferase